MKSSKEHALLPLSTKSTKIPRSKGAPELGISHRCRAGFLTQERPCVVGVGQERMEKQEVKRIVLGFYLSRCISPSSNT